MVKVGDEFLGPVSGKRDVGGTIPKTPVVINTVYLKGDKGDKGDADLTGIQSVTGLAGIKALSNSSTGVIIRETSLGELWQKQPTGTATADDITVVTVTDASCQFHRIVGSGPVAKWRAQAAWYIDGTSGSDWDTGATGHALKTGKELRRRLGDRIYWNNSVTINGLSDIDELVLDYVLESASLTITVSFAAKATLYSGTISDVTQTSANVPRKIRVTGLNWTTAGTGSTSLLLKRGRIVSGTAANIGALFWIAITNPEGSGSDWVRISNPMTTNGTQRTLAIGDGFVVEDLPSVGVFDIRFSGYTTNPQTAGNGALQASGFACAKTSIRGFSNFNYQAYLFGCDLSNTFGADSLGHRTPIRTICCKFALDSFGGISTDGSLWISTGSGTLGLQGACVFYAHELYQGLSVFVTSGLVVTNGSLHVMDSPGVGMSIYAGCTLAATSAIAGAGNAGAGVEIRPGGRFVYPASTPPTLTGATGDCSLLIVGQIIPWSALPWNDGAQSGTSTLVSGTKSVPVPYRLSTQKPVITRNTPAGDIGELYAPDSGLSSTSFTVTSYNGQDASSFNWFIPPTGYNQVVDPYF